MAMGNGVVINSDGHGALILVGIEFIAGEELSFASFSLADDDYFVVGEIFLFEFAHIHNDRFLLNKYSLAIELNILVDYHYFKVEKQKKFIRKDML